MRDWSLDGEGVREKDREGRVLVCGTVLVVSVAESEAERDGADAEMLRVAEGWEGVPVWVRVKLPKVAVVKEAVGVVERLGGLAVTDCVQVLVLTGVQDTVAELDSEAVGEGDCTDLVMEGVGVGDSLWLGLFELLRVGGLGVSVRVAVGTQVRLGEMLNEADRGENDLLLGVPLMVPPEGVTLQDVSDRVRIVAV